MNRSYIVRVPPAYDGKHAVPLVVLLHGATDSAEYAEKAYHFDEKADAEGFVLVLPDALGDFHAWNPFVTADEAETPNKDVAFLTMLVETIKKSYAIDPHRVYIAGHSSGAMMTYRMVAEHPEFFAAAGIVAGTVGETNASLPRPKGTMPLIIFHGMKDTNVPYGEPRTGNMARAVAFWTVVNRCSPAPEETTFPVKTVRRDYYISKAVGHPDVMVYTTMNGNHMWPGGNLMPNKSEQPVQDISATDLMWDFFKLHVKG